MASVEFLFDFGSPNAYLSHSVLSALQARTGATAIYVPILLGGVFKLTGNQSPATAFAAYVEAVYVAMWEDGLKMDDPEVWRAVMAAQGLPADEIVRLSQTPEVKGELAANTDKAVERGAFGSPTFFVGQEMFFGKDRLGEVEAEILAQRAATF